ncbi:hypothetical protein [Citrobacter sp. Igbk 16]|uniref:hypothetical protein n=1 Tax=Citrobacter sp. Igbk 16 TaxID=2963958 RepID=UPI0023028227|nr:hypothetical protein [Citrobacter sp. Igbk 16]MDA8518691.1 hypothetical protein [Citrobacter sp. Igbk 16]
MKNSYPDIIIEPNGVINLADYITAGSDLVFLQCKNGCVIVNNDGSTEHGFILTNYTVQYFLAAPQPIYIVNKNGTIGARVAVMTGTK